MATGLFIDHRLTSIIEELVEDGVKPNQALIVASETCPDLHISPPTAMEWAMLLGYANEVAKTIKPRCVCASFARGEHTDPHCPIHGDL